MKKAKSKASDSMMPREMLLRGQRCTTAKQLKAYVHDYVGLHLLGIPGYKSIEELVEKLERIDPNPDSKWTRHRLYHHFVKVKAAMISEQQGDDCKAGKQSADGAPEGDHTSGLDLALFDHAAASPSASSSRRNAKTRQSPWPSGEFLKASMTGLCPRT